MVEVSRVSRCYSLALSMLTSYRSSTQLIVFDRNQRVRYINSSMLRNQKCKCDFAYSVACVKSYCTAQIYKN